MRSTSSSHDFWILVMMMMILFSGWMVNRCNGLRHSFTTHQDRRTLIGPVGIPFGFVSGGHFELTVYDFELTDIFSSSTEQQPPNKKQQQQTTKKAKQKEDHDDYDEDKNPFPGLTPGFYLHRFRNDAAYTKYLNGLRSNASACSFEYFLDRSSSTNEVLTDDTVLYEEVGEFTSAEHGILLMMRPRQTKWKPAPPTTIRYTFDHNNDNSKNKKEQGLYFLTYQICTNGDRYVHDLERVQSSFELDFQFQNVDPVSGRATYLTAGEVQLPSLFFFFSMSYLICAGLWIANLRAIEQGGHGIFDPTSSTSTTTNNVRIPVVYPIHKLMGVLLCLKFLSVFFEAVRYHAIRITGHAELWSAVYYTVSFIKGIFMFTVILLIGSGWSFVKPFLNPGEKRVVCGILVLQIINNMAIAILSHETTGERQFAQWNAILHCVDILCCCAVLLPIVWHVNALEKSLPNNNKTTTTSKHQQQQQQKRIMASHKNNSNHVPLDEHDDDLPDDELMEMELHYNDDDDNEEDMDYNNYATEQDREKGHIVSKLKLFRSFYILVVAYIYMTRILVYLFATLLDYRHLWVRYALVEIITLTFYVTVGILFRPMMENPYLSLPQQQQQRSDAADNNNNNNDREDGIDLMPILPTTAAITTTITTRKK